MINKGEPSPCISPFPPDFLSRRLTIFGLLSWFTFQWSRTQNPWGLGLQDVCFLVFLCQGFNTFKWMLKSNHHFPRQIRLSLSDPWGSWNCHPPLAEPEKLSTCIFGMQKHQFELFRPSWTHCEKNLNYMPTGRDCHKIQLVESRDCHQT